MVSTTGNESGLTQLGIVSRVRTSMKLSGKSGAWRSEKSSVDSPWLANLIKRVQKDASLSIFSYKKVLIIVLIDNIHTFTSFIRGADKYTIAPSLLTRSFINSYTHSFIHY